MIGFLQLKDNLFFFSFSLAGLDLDIFVVKACNVGRKLVD